MKLQVTIQLGGTWQPYEKENVSPELIMHDLIACHFSDTTITDIQKKKEE